MTDCTTHVRKGRSGWQAETVLALGFEVEGKPAELHVSTYKASRGLATYAGVKLRDGHFITTRVFSDFHQRCELSALRCTEGNVQKQHNFWLARIDDLKGQALEFHTAKGDLPAAEPIAA